MNDKSLKIDIDSESVESPVNDTSQDAVFGWIWWVIPLIILVCVTVICNFTKLDIWISSNFYSFDTGSWYYRGSMISLAIYRLTPVPGILFGLGCLVLGSLGFFMPDIQRLSRPALFCALVVLLGPTLIVNSFLKPVWGRPRPNRVEIFGGKQPFVGPGYLAGYQGARSFPSGHAAIAFVLMTPAFLFYRRSKKKAALWFATGLLLGASVGLSRIADGGHFFSDIVWSCGIVYFSGLTLYFLMQKWIHAVEPSSDCSRSESQSPVVPSNSVASNQNHSQAA